MEQKIMPILVALSAALLVWGIWRLWLDLSGSDRRKIAERLTSDRNDDVTAGANTVRRSVERGDLTGLFGRWSAMQELHRSLLQSFPDMAFGKFLWICAGTAFGAFLIITALSASFFVGLVAGALGLFAPIMVVTNRRNRRQKLMVNQLPESLDFLSRALRAGHSFATGLQMMSEELPQPLAGEFRRAYDQHSVGISLEQALKDMVQRIDSTDFAFFVTATLIQRQTGGDLSEVLKNISGMIRQRIRLQQHVKAKTAEGRFTGYILAAFPFLMFVISYTLNPTYAGVLIQSSTGIGMLITAFAMTLLGLFLIRKLTTVKV